VSWSEKCDMTNSKYIPLIVPNDASVEAFVKDGCEDFIHLWVRKEFFAAKWNKISDSRFNYKAKMLLIKIEISASYN